RKVGVNDRDVNVFTVEALFSTLTNVDFDPERFAALIRQAVNHREALKDKVKTAGGKVDFNHAAATFTPADT
ncbi:MAG: hydroxylamine reductase, partial [Nitrospinaceae bacterium]|nr:hydroxylamine reductase [Nitrospinaceae bacterium]NIT84737.1 hydroxylamine reductase [Nitrospinaceae bacterium]NIU46915.1 hydroxylamine reductase [Nitrospinaceae bacterium]NIU99116.1 hydroxylamine reductase [Nitrospinaceae bacterium]NIW61665.1 hydroxylamine reductase [Nitrospinaceae bacterium]